MPDANVEAIGGWLKDADAHLERTYRRLQDIDPTTMNPEHLAYFEDYRTRYFNDRLIHGRGVEEILETLTRFSSTPEHWIDLGAGVTTLFWSIGVNKPKSVSACDIVPEALHILSAFKSSDELPPCYIEAMQLVGRSMKDLQATRSLPWNFHIVDCLSPWSIPGHTDGFDLITAIGCFGLASGKDGYALPSAPLPAIFDRQVDWSASIGSAVQHSSLKKAKTTAMLDQTSQSIARVLKGSRS
jgi:hypothetical protein